jgi:ribonuclease P protein component
MKNTAHENAETLFPATVPESAAAAPGKARLPSRRYPVFDGKKVFRARSLVVWVARGAAAGRKAGVVVSKRTFRRAVDRNRAKRLMREAFRLLRPSFAPDVELILVARAGIGGLSCRDVAGDLAYVARKSGIFADGMADGRR